MFGLFELGSDFSADDAARLRRIEYKLDLLLKHLGLEATPDVGDLPPPARERADAGDKIGAIAAYRATTGAGLAEAKRAIERYLGSAPKRL